MSVCDSEGSKRAMAAYLGRLPKGVKRTILSQHIKALRAYARRAMLEPDALNPDEEQDREIRMREYMAIGKSFDLTEGQIVRHLLKGVFPAKPACECPTCRAN